MKNTYFAYKSGNSFLHRMKPWIKIIVIPVLSILFFILPWYFSAGLIVLQTVLCFVLKFTVREQFNDIKAVLYYAVILYFFSFIANTASLYMSQFAEDYSGQQLTFIQSICNSAKTVFSNTETLIMLMKLLCIMQTASLVFRTSTSLELRQGIETIETTVRKILHLKPVNRLTNVLSMFICFIPMVFRIWGEAKRAWYARQGKNSIKMYITLLPVLFSVGIKKAYNEAKAVAIRSED